ncbi:MAG: ABC transporter ATP-binding protein [Clostridia bacterium]
MTAKENIMLPLLIDGRDVDGEYFEHVVEVLGLHSRLGHLPGQMSGGQQQRTAIARAVMNKPPILLCDEPTGNLDSKTSAEVIALLLEVTQDFHMTLILVTHDRKLADKMEAVITIQDGRIGGGYLES